MKHYDCHCHVFNFLSIGWRAVIQSLDELHGLRPVKRMPAVSEAETVKQRNRLRSRIKQAVRLIRTLRAGSRRLAIRLDNHYRRNGNFGKDCVLFPLMFDGDHLLKASNVAASLDVLRFIDKTKRDFEAEQRGTNALTAATKADLDLAGDLKELNIHFAELENVNTRQGKRRRQDGFARQIEELKEIKNMPRFRNRVFPFLGVDPRRPDIKQYLSQVGKGKFFAGVKIYAPNGFSPADPVLYGPDSVFEFCSKNNIPVICHASYGGFATPVTRINVDGFVIPEDGNTPVAHKGAYQFKTSLADGFAVLVKERARVLNHPLIWRKVLDKYNKLILVMGHFGNGSDEWKLEITRLIEDFPHVYTDISCMSKTEELRAVKTIIDSNSLVSDRVLYGSDFFLEAFFNPSFKVYVNSIKAVFGGKLLKKISTVNPASFCKLW
jgi:predicted TIM-barrel fold metal-dependent hydrolase